jgi:hypothetical protein
MSRLGIDLLALTQISLSAQDQAREAAIEQWPAHRVGLFVSVQQASLPEHLRRHAQVNGLEYLRNALAR